MKKAMICLIFSLLFLTGGCMNGTGIGDLAVILGASVGVEESGNLRVAVELAHRGSLDGEDESIIVTASASDWQGIESELSRKCDKALYWGHLVLLLFDKDCGSQRIEELAEAFYLDQRLSPVIYTAICLQDGAALLGEGFGESSYFSQGIALRMSAAAKSYPDMCFTVEKCMQRIYHGSTPQMISLILTEDGVEFDRVVDIDDI